MDNASKNDPLMCQICFKRFGKLQQHMRTHSGERPFECELCKKRFKQRAHLERHTLSHTGEKPFKCRLCGKTAAAKSDLLKHMKIHAKREYAKRKHAKRDEEKTKSHACLYCSKTFSSLATLRDHMLIHAEERPHRCEMCTQSFRHRGYLAAHMLIHGVKPLTCHLCGKGSTCKSSLVKHLKIHERRDGGKDETKSHICSICSKVCHSLSGLKSHASIHAEEKLHKCRLCAISFHLKSQLTLHFNTRHKAGNVEDCLNVKLDGTELTEAGRNLSKCPICLGRYKYLKQHVQTHMDERPYGCELCKKRFRQHGHLKRHMLFHSGEKPFKCNLCGKASATRNGIASHYKNIHEKKDDTDKTKSYACPTCSKGFLSLPGLRAHVLSHTDEKPHQCQLCAMSFRYSSQLVKHLYGQHAGGNVGGVLETIKVEEIQIIDEVVKEEIEFNVHS